MISNMLKHIINKNNFNLYGGKQLGLNVISHLISEGFPISTPKSFFISLNDMKKKWEIETVESENYTFKYSTLDDDFSDESLRGKNSSLGRKLPLGKSLIQQACKDIPPTTVGVIFQQFVESTDAYFIVHVHVNSIKIEITDQHNQYAAILDESYVPTSYSCKDYFHSNLNRYLKLITKSSFYKMRARCGFDLNLEGFISNDEVILIQLRPVPADELTSVHISRKISKRGAPLYQTNFVYNAYEYYNVSLSETFGIYMCHENQELCSVPEVIELLRSRQAILVANHETAFNLSHSPKHIPENVEYREFFRYLYLHQSEKENLLHKKIDILSDGNQCFIYDSET